VRALVIDKVIRAPANGDTENEYCRLGYLMTCFLYLTRISFDMVPKVSIMVKKRAYIL